MMNSENQTKKRGGLKRYFVVGLFIFLFGLLRGWATLTNIFSEKPHVDFQFKIVEWTCNILLIIIGLSILFYKKRAVIRLSLVFISLFIFSGIMETALRSRFFDGDLAHAPVWISLKSKAINDQINLKNKLFAKNNPYGFNDKVRSLDKPPGIKRIAVLGDSFVWGDGVDYDTAWGHKLERKVSEKYPAVEVMSWGRNGWSTLGEFDFLKKTGILFDIDYLIVGFVNNDPDMNDDEQKNFVWQLSPSLKLAQVFLPNTVDFLSTHINNILERYLFKDFGYAPWIQKLYTSENLKKYGTLLKNLSQFLKEQQIPVLFVLTPNDPASDYRIQFDQILPLLSSAQIHTLDLYPAVEKKFKGNVGRLLWANPANGHPNGQVTEVYSNEVFDYLEKELVLKNLSQGDPLP